MGYSSFQIGCVIVEYGLFNTTNFTQNLIYIRFGIILIQFYINFLRQEHQIDVLYVSFKIWDSRVSSYTPFHFSFTVPLRMKNVAALTLKMERHWKLRPLVPLLSNQYRITCTGEYSMMSPLSSLTTIMFMIQGPAALMVSFVFPSLAISSFVRLHVSRSFRAYITSNKITYNI